MTRSCLLHVNLSQILTVLVGEFACSCFFVRTVLFGWCKTLSLTPLRSFHTCSSTMRVLFFWSATLCLVWVLGTPCSALKSHWELVFPYMCILISAQQKTWVLAFNSSAWLSSILACKLFSVLTFLSSTIYYLLSGRLEGS